MGSTRREATQPARIQEEEPGRKGLLKGVDEVVSADEKDESKVTDRLVRMPGRPAPYPWSSEVQCRSTMRRAGAAAARKHHGRHST